MNTEEKVNENETEVHRVTELTGNREDRRRQAKRIARANHVPFQTVNQVLNKKVSGPVKL